MKTNRTSMTAGAGLTLIRICRRCGEGYSGLSCETCATIRGVARETAARLLANGVCEPYFLATEDPPVLYLQDRIRVELLEQRRTRDLRAEARLASRAVESRWRLEQQKLRHALEWALIWGALLLSGSVLALGAWQGFRLLLAGALKITAALGGGQ